MAIRDSHVEKPRIAFEALEMDKGQLKGLLHYIFCILFAPQHSARNVKDRFLRTVCKGSRRQPNHHVLQRQETAYSSLAIVASPSRSVRSFTVVIL